MRMFLPLLAILTLTTPALADPFWLSEPGLCDADEGDIEHEGAIYLTKTGLSSHWFGCDWPQDAGAALLRGDQEFITTATCANATSAWEAELTIVGQGDGSVKVHQHTGGLSPVRFFRCEG